MARVAVVKSGSSPDTIRSAVRRAIELSGGLDGIIKPGQRVLIKPNFVAPVLAGVTDFSVIEEVVSLVVGVGATPVIGECPGFEYDSRVTFKILGIKQLADRLGVECINFEEDDYVWAPYNHPLVKKVRIARSAAECDGIINLPRMKSHKLTDVSLSIKNCFGMISKTSRREIHSKGLDRGIAALNTLFKPVLNVIDGLEIPATGAVYGEHIPYGIIAASTDMLSLDMITCKLLGFEPRNVKHIRLASRGSFPAIDVVGDKVDPLVVQGKLNPRKIGHYRRFTTALYAFDHCISRLGARSIIPWFHTRIGVHPKINWSKCTGCDKCMQLCPVDAIDIDNKRIDYGLCSKARCMICMDGCERNAISIKQAFKA